MKKSRYTNKLSVLKEYKESERFGDICRGREIWNERKKDRERKTEREGENDIERMIERNKKR